MNGWPKINGDTYLPPGTLKINEAPKVAELPDGTFWVTWVFAYTPPSNKQD